MKVIAISGTPRKGWNTSMLLDKLLEGARSKGAETEIINLHDLDYKGCKSCFACKTIGGKSYGKCIMKDGLTRVLEKIQNADALVLGSPIYFGRVSGQMAVFLERLLFPYITYETPSKSLFPKMINTGFIYTMNVADEQMREAGIDTHIHFNEKMLSIAFGKCESFMSFYTLQADDYNKFLVAADGETRIKRRKEEFPKDLDKVFEIGVKLATES